MSGKEFLQGVFSDNGVPSSSRVLTGVVVAFSCGWITAIVRHSHQLPELGGICLLIGTLYGVNTAGNAIKGRGDKSGPPE